MTGLFGNFKDKITQLRCDKKELKKHRLQENSGVHWINSNKVSKGECAYCKHGSSKVYQCL